MDADTMALNCWIRGREDVKVFQINISRTQTVLGLAEAIASRRPDAIGDMPSDSLDLYKPKHSIIRPWKENLGEFILSEHAELLEMVDLSELFPETPPRNHIHVIVDAPTITCWLRGRTLNSNFGISTRLGTTNQVKAYIKKTYLRHENVEDGDMRLYRISGGDNELQESLNKMGDGEPLRMIVLLANFGGVPVLDPLCVVVEHDSVVSKGKKRKRGEDDDAEKNYLQEAQLANVPPSNLAQPRQFSKWRQSPKGAEIVDHRCLCEKGLVVSGYPHISLQYEGFGDFIDIFRGGKGVPGMENVPSTNVGSAVNVFAEGMSLMYADEQVIATRGLDALNKVFSVSLDGVSFELKGAVGGNDSRSDGHYLGPHGAATCIAVFKNEAAGSAIPYVEMTGYFAHSTRNTLWDPDSLIGRWNYPCLGLTVVGHYVTFYGMIYNGPNHGWRVDALTSPLSCILDKDRDALHDAFVAALVLLARIDKDAEQLKRNPPPMMQGNRVLPPISSLRRPDFQSTITFKIISEFFPARGADRFLYTAKTTEGGEEKYIVIKFAEKYSDELHKFCADRGHAPKLLGFQRLPGGFLGIAMEYVASIPDSEIESGWEEQLQDLVESFHAENLVHGDLRKPNIIISEGNKAMLIDFDWAGKEGEACYPRGSRLNGELILGRRSTDLVITKDDDRRVLSLTCGWGWKLRS